MKKLLFALLCVALVGVAGHADFEDVTKTMFAKAPGKGGGVTWADLDWDGFPDLIVNGKVYRNKRGRAFADVTPRGWKHSGPSVVADFDGDGNPDVFFPSSYRYYLGDGKFNFKERKLPEIKERCSLGACAADFDGDGWVDVFYTGYEIWNRNRSYPDYVLKNEKGKFRILWQSPRHQTMRCHGGVTACDFNEDGAPEVYVANYRLQPNHLWFKVGTGNLIDCARKLGVAGTERCNTPFTNDLGTLYYSSGHTISAVWADFDNDGLFDLFVGNFSHPPAYQDRPQMLRNMGRREDWLFEDMSKVSNLRWQESYAGSAAGDYDNDGLIDLMFTTVYKGDKGVLLHNEGEWKFKEETRNIQCHSTYQAAWADFDRDGCLDLFTNGQLYRNRGQKGGFVQVTLRGKKRNSMAIGAVVKLEGGKGVQVRQVEAGTGCGSQNDATLHFGLGKVKRGQEFRLEIRWPDGNVKRQRVRANGRMVLKE